MKMTLNTINHKCLKRYFNVLITISVNSQYFILFCFIICVVEYLSWTYDVNWILIDIVRHNPTWNLSTFFMRSLTVDGKGVKTLLLHKKNVQFWKFTGLKSRPSTVSDLIKKVDKFHVGLCRTISINIQLTSYTIC
jgi:hypothetical protein